MSNLDKAREHFATAETASIDVTEWEVTIYWRPWTINDRQKVWGAIKASGREAELSARVLITKALDKDGKNLYSLADLRVLCHEVDSAVVERIAVAIIGTQPSEAEVEKN